LVRTAVIIPFEVGVENTLHLVDRVEPGTPALDAEVLVEQRAVQALDDAIGLRAFNPGGAVLDAFELQEQLVGMPIGPTSESTASMVVSCASKVGRTSLFIRWTAVIGSLLG
jgi:hypothetical protein